jgi:RimJ/RimL family protein N-acetyltransferase
VRARTATPDDAEAFAAVVRAVADERRWIATQPPVDIRSFAERVRTSLAGGDALWILEDGAGDVVGTLGLHRTKARGRGGGHVLLDAAMAWLAGRDIHKVELEVWPDNAAAIALYTQYGFEVEGLRRDHYRREDGSLRSALIMARRLTP